MVLYLSGTSYRLPVTRVSSFVVLAAMLFSACEAPPVAAEPEQIAEIDRCRVIAEATMELIDEYLEAIESLTPADLTAGTEPVLVDLDERSAAVEARSAELGCSDIEIRDRVSPHVEDLEGSSLAAREFIRRLQAAYGVVP